ncbi:SIMPL domain-containing protein [Maribacter sp. 2308TA10-17]|uniref:SIMPL domain-containing protein n=1 Tax=Maribacter sp. 2308TA10-17 TaxID=3386276 RepID=UPI0039BC289F
MKKLAASLVMFLITMTAMAQNYQNNITVNGVHSYSINPEYSSKMIVSLNNVYYDSQTMSMSEVKSGYFDKLAKVGISSDRLTEDNLHYALLGYEKEGTIIVFKTNSLEEMQKFLNVKSIGVTRSDTTLEMELTDAQMADYAKAAFENAKTKADAIAAKIGRTTGKAIYLSDTNTKKISESMYYSSVKDKRDYYISVSFELQ